MPLRLRVLLLPLYRLLVLLPLPLRPWVLLLPLYRLLVLLLPSLHR